MNKSCYQKSQVTLKIQYITIGFLLLEDKEPLMKNLCLSEEFTCSWRCFDKCHPKNNVYNPYLSYHWADLHNI